MAGLPFAVSEVASIASTTALPLLSGMGSFVTSVLAFQGASDVITDVSKALAPSAKVTANEFDNLNLFNQGLKKGQKIDDIFTKSPLNKF